MRFLKSFLSLALCLVVSAALFAQVDLNNGLQAYYPFSGNANDVSGHGNNPIVTSATLTSDYYGKANSAYYFDGASNYIQIPNSTSLNPGNTISVCAWIKPQGFYQGKCHGNRVVMKGLDYGSTLGNYLLTFDDNYYTNNQNCIIPYPDTLHETAYGYGTDISQAIETPYILSNVWHSLVYTYDGTYARLYVDCQLTIETYNPGFSFGNTADLFIGRMNDSQYPYFFNGIIDEVRIYNRALSSQEIQAYAFGCNPAVIQDPSFCTGSLGDPIVNITFGSGNNPGSQLSSIVPGASTTYGFTPVYGSPASPVPQDGYYTVTNNVPANVDWFQGATDHTGNTNGYMAFFNANPTPGEFYKQTVSNLCPGTSYQFSAWLANVLNPNRNIGVLPDVTFRIEKSDGTLVASYRTGGIPQSSSMTWKEYGFFFTTPADGSTLVLKMINTNVGGTAQPGNDFAVDDITFRACTAQLTASFNANTLQNTLTACPGTGITLYGTANPQTGNYDYLWQVSSNKGTTWTDIANSNKLSLPLTTPSQAGATFLYRMLSAQKGNIASVNCRGASDTIALNVSSLCAKEKIPCNNWYYNVNETGAFQSGDLDVNGHTITVEADINRTEPYVRQGADSTIDGDVVSKHRDRLTSNYLLRPNRTEISTTNGYFRTPDVCEIELNKTYHVAMTYDGTTLKFYRNGYLMASVPATGELITNDFPLTIGNLAYSPGYDNSTFKGYINNVRIWNVARTQSQIQSYMDSTLPNPAGQAGLLAEYRFDDLTNKQGDASLDGYVTNGATFNQSNPTCESFAADSCTKCSSNWLQVKSNGSGVKTGDVDIAGQKLTVEATFNSTQTHTGGRLYAGDIVSKHANPGTINYLLRPNSAEITTSNGYFITPPVCDAELNKTYHVAMVYDGTTLKFYRDGFLLSQIACTGDLYQNNFPTTIGAKASEPAALPDESFTGYINEVRIWNTVRSQDNIRQYMDQSLPSPQSQTGLVAYYTFDNLTNKQGNTAWNGALFNNAAINQNNPTCDAFSVDSCNACGNWLYTPSDPSYVDIGKLNVAGNKITVEAEFNRIAPYSPGTGDNSDGDLVSKHTDPTNTNYILRPNHAYITTTNGFYGTPDACDIELNKTYHVAMVYDGATLKFYRNGFLLSQTPATGNLYQNDFETLIGRYTGIIKENFIGYINEVRIWNVARTQSQIQAYIDKPLPNPTTQSGLLAYYTFDNLLNKQGNAAWNGNLIGSASINQTNPTCSDFVADSCGNVVVPPIVTADFNAPDTVCVNTSITLQNKSENATSSYWSFCSTDLNTTAPEAVNIGNPGGIVSWPVFMDLVQEGGKYYGFLVDHHPGNLIRLDFGSSFLNTPTAVNLGNFGGILPADFGAEGIQMVKNAGTWYAIIVGGSTQNNETPRIIKIDFGANILNASPAATNWGNIGNLAQPIDLYVFYESGSWYGFTTNAENNTITRFNFGTGFELTPTGTNLGSFNGTLNYPTGIYPINDDGNWHLFVTNYNGNSLTRLDFGNSLLNTATATNLGSLGGILKQPRDITLLKSCNGLIGYAVNGLATSGELIKIDFHNNILGIPTATSFGNNGNYSFPHSISKLFRVGNDLYSFITNVNNNTLTRLKFPGCNSSSIPNYQGTNPPPVSYSSPGLYNVVLSVDEGLPTQTTSCRQIAVLPKLTQAPNKDTVLCGAGSQLRLSVSAPYATYSWNTGSTDSAITVTTPGKYWVQLNKGYSCTTTDTFNVTLSTLAVNLGKDTGLCAGQTILLNAGNSSSTYLWQDGSTKPTYTATKGGSYYVRVTDASRCTKTDTIQIANFPSPLLSNLQDSKICSGNSVQLSVTASGTGNVYSWSPAATLNNPTIANPVAKPADTTNYTVTVTNTNGCSSKDTTTVYVLQKPVATSIADTGICIGNSVALQSSVANAGSYSWSPSTGLSSTSDISPKAMPASTTAYVLTAKNDACSASDTVNLTVYSLPAINVSNDTLVCGTTSVQLSASGGNKYQWSPATGLSNPNIANPVATVNQPVTYLVTVTDKNGCVNKDSVHISSGSLTQFSAGTTTPEVCVGDSIKLNASGGSQYIWKPSQSVSNPNDSSTYAIATTSTVYTVQINNVQCQTSATKDVAVTVNPLPQIRIAKSNDIDCRMKEATLTASGAASYTWSPVTSGSGDSATITVMPDETTVYKVTATSDKGCKSSDTVTVKVNIDLEHQYPMQNAFSPNGDGINDCFGIRSWNVIKVDFEIFDRWGMMLFHSTDPANVCWDGRYKNKNQLDGTYVYKIYAITDCGIINKAGAFVLIRAAR